MVPRWLDAKTEDLVSYYEDLNSLKSESDGYRLRLIESIRKSKTE